METGKIIKIISNLFTVQIDTRRIPCQARGKFRKEKITPLVGDYCEVDVEQKYIMKILPRKNFMFRPMISNVDVALIVTSLKKPEISYHLLDKLISIITLNNINPMICITKQDLMSKEEMQSFEEVKKYYENLGYSCFYNTEIDIMKQALKGKIVVVTGQTGAGKSTLLNKLNPNLELKTNPISEALGRGIHTTRHTEIYDIDGIYFADTPGFSSLDLTEFKKEEIRNSFLEFSDYPCKFKDCSHIKEQNCNVKNALEEGNILLSRYESYLDFIKEVDEC